MMLLKFAMAGIVTSSESARFACSAGLVERWGCRDRRMSGQILLLLGKNPVLAFLGGG